MEYRLLKVPELKRELLRRGLDSIGTRRELTARLVDHDAEVQSGVEESQKSNEAANAEDVEVLEVRSVDFDLYGGVKDEGEDMPSDAALQDLLRSSLAESAESPADGPPETKKVLPRKRTAEVKEVKRKVLPRRAEASNVQRVLPRKRATQVATPKAPAERVEALTPGAVLKRLLQRMGSYGTYDNLITRLHATLKPCEVSGENPSGDQACERVGEGPEAALEAAWGPAQSEMVPCDMPAEVQEVLPQELAPEEVPAPPDLGELELKVQQAMRRTARAQMQLRRKKAEELMLMGLLKHCEAACNVYREKEGLGSSYKLFSLCQEGLLRGLRLSDYLDFGGRKAFGVAYFLLGGKTKKELSSGCAELVWTV